MPYRSIAQIRYLHSQKPAVAALWDKQFGKPGPLPYHVKKRKVRMRRKP